MGEEKGLEERVSQLERIVTGQTALIAALVGVLHMNNGLTRQEAEAVLVAFQAPEVEQIESDQVLAWARARFSK